MSRQLMRKIVSRLNRNLIKLHLHKISCMNSQTISGVVPRHRMAFGQWKWRCVGAGQNASGSVMTWKLDAWRESRTYGYYFKCDNNHREKVINVHVLGSLCVCAQPMREGTTVWHHFSFWLGPCTECSLHVTTVHNGTFLARLSMSSKFCKRYKISRSQIARWNFIRLNGHPCIELMTC